MFLSEEKALTPGWFPVRTMRKTNQTRTEIEAEENEVNNEPGDSRADPGVFQRGGGSLG